MLAQYWSPSLSELFQVLTSSTSEVQSLIWVHYFHVAPHEWWHVSPRFSPLGPLKKPKLPATCPSVLPRHDDIRCHCNFIIANHMLLRALKEEREKGSPTFGFEMKSIVNPFWHSLTFFNAVEALPMSQLLKGCHPQNFQFSNCRCFDVAILWCANFLWDIIVLALMHWTPGM